MWFANNDGESPEVWPKDDLKPHHRGSACWCAPYDDGGVMVHQAMDQREKYERGERLPS